MSSTATLGELELLVLLAVMRQGRSGYAVSVQAELERATGRALSRGATYVTLDRLEHKGFLRSWMGEPTAERGGKAKRLYEVTVNGRAAAQTALRQTRTLADDLGLEQS
jgi:PadR family transcriptional regulator, regulatory protein PadR